MYNDFFGFTDKPFNVTPDPRFLYLSPSHQEALASMLYGIRERKGFVSIIGEVGTGKTTLLHALFNELEKEVKTISIFNTTINFNQLLQNILMELEVNPKSNNKIELLNQLNEFLIDKLSLGENVALIIDEAQNLSHQVLEELRMLSNLETDRDKLLQIILVGQPELDTKLRSPHLRQLKQRIGINCYLTPLNYEQSLNYISHRLHIVDSNDHIFTPEALKLICESSRGIPRVINIVCDNALLTAYGKGEKTIDHAIAKEVVADFDRQRVITITGEKGKAPPKITKKRGGILFLVFLAALLSLIIAFLVASLYQPLLLNTIKNRFFSFYSGSVDQQKDPRSSPPEMSAHQPPEAALPLQPPPVPQNTVAEESPQGSSSPFTPEVNPATTPLPSATISEGTPTLSAEEEHKSLVVKEGDTLSKILTSEYGFLNDNLYEMVKSSNPDVQDINQISVGQKIFLPSLDFNSQVVELAPHVYSFHIASFASYTGAKRYLNSLIEKNYPLHITPVKGFEGKTWYRIMIGQFSNRDDAVTFAKNIKNAP